jgi:anti-anti-sigma regulatory factor
MFKPGDEKYRYLKTVVGDELVHVVVADDVGTLASFADFIGDLAEAERAGGTIIVDLQSVRLLEGQLVDCLQRARRRIAARGDRFMLACPDGSTRTLLRLTGADRGLFHDSVADALVAVRSGR